MRLLGCVRSVPLAATRLRLAFATPIEVWHAASDRKLERDWAGLLESDPRFSCPIPRFGSSDYHRSRISHLFFSKRRPSFQQFEQRVRSVFEHERQVAACGAGR